MLETNDNKIGNFFNLHSTYIIVVLQDIIHQDLLSMGGQAIHVNHGCMKFMNIIISKCFVMSDGGSIIYLFALKKKNGLRQAATLNNDTHNT
jgi:hypothetical protein